MRRRAVVLAGVAVAVAGLGLFAWTRDDRGDLVVLRSESRVGGWLVRVGPGDETVDIDIDA